MDGARTNKCFKHVLFAQCEHALHSVYTCMYVCMYACMCVCYMHII